jgi:translation initiation factor IF-1
VSKDDVIQAEGTVVAIFKGDFYAVQLPTHQVTCKRSGKLVKNKIRLLLGDSVTVEISVYDLKRGRIVYRRLTNQVEPKQH